MFVRCLWFIATGLSFQNALSQTVHTVTLGLTGIAPDPPTTTAQAGDIVNFVFGAGVHSVTQSSFEAPCVPLPGGFNSGLVSIPDGSGTNRTWGLQITDASKPIWFYCQSVRPTPHCPDGMAGVINAPADMYASFHSAAALFTGTQDPAPSVVLSGIGAFAAESPAAPGASGSVSHSPTSSLPPSQTPTSLVSSTPTPTARGSTNSGATAEGHVRVIAALGIIITLATLL